MSTKRKGPGRPPAGDSGEEVRGYARMLILMKPATKAQVKTLCSFTGLPAWRVFEQALAAYIKSLPAEDRRVLEALAERIDAKQK